MKKNIILIIILLIIIALAAYFILRDKNPSEEEQREIVNQYNVVVDSLSDVIKGVENPAPDYQISISGAREKAIAIFSKLGENKLNKDKVFVQEFVDKGVKYYLVSSPKNTAVIEINTGKVTRINGNILQ